MKEQEKLIKETIEELLGKMGFEASVEISGNFEDNEDGVTCNIQTGDASSFLIGQYGANLQAVQHIARLLVRKKTSEKANFIIDVNSYRKSKNESVIELAKETAQQVINDKRAVVMRPMSNYERRIVHLELSKDERILTESIGEGEGRKVVVKPAESI